MSRRLKIGVDIDGVLIDTDARAYLEFCESELGWEADYKIYEKTHSWFQATKQDSSEVLARGFERFITEVEKSQHPIDGAHDALKKLGEIADIYLITARAGMLRQVTETFLKKHLPDVHYHELSMDNVENKTPSIINFGIDYYIDDSYREISLILQDKTVETIVIPFPAFHGVPEWETISDQRMRWLSVWDTINHNIDTNHQPTIRKKAWEEITNIILSDKSRVHT